jgi:CMP-N-acetylneuraminic acid synthetase
MVELDRNGFASLSKKPEGRIVRRQDAPVVYAMNASVYVWKTDILFQREDIISGRTKFVEMPDDRSIDIDSKIDFKLVELIMKERQDK